MNAQTPPFTKRALKKLHTPRHHLCCTFSCSYQEQELYKTICVYRSLFYYTTIQIVHNLSLSLTEQLFEPYIFKLKPTFRRREKLWKKIIWNCEDFWAFGKLKGQITKFFHAPTTRAHRAGHSEPNNSGNTSSTRAWTVFPSALHDGKPPFKRRNK